MRFEDLDKKIKEAADQHHPAYDEKAWQKMERLLDQHLPKPKNDNRRIFLFLLTFLLVGGGMFVLISRPWKRESQIAVQSTKAINNSPKSSIDQAKAPPRGQDAAREMVSEKEEKLKAPEEDLSERNISSRGDKNLVFTPSKSVTSNKHQLLISQTKDPNDQSVTSKIERNGSDKPPVEDEKKMPSGNQDIGAKSDLPTIAPIKSNTQDAKKVEVKQMNETDKPDATNAERKSSKPKRTAKPINGNGFSFSVSVGPDVSKAGSSKAGEATLAYGAGVGYTLNRFTLRTGVYAAKKIYWANADDYKLDYVPPIAQFEGSDADCYVVEVPLKLSYSFAFSNKSNWFAGAGLSSYFMKRETYNYKLKTSSGGTYWHPHEVKNENKHYFSILNLSGGYTHQINKIFSISAEPYMELPLTGVGEGKVHLKSGGVLFTLGVKPFKR
jgi:hypothetical protein